jgi:uncharacterized protein
MLGLNQLSGLYLAPTDGKGLGLFSTQRINANEIIESCVAVVFDGPDAELVSQTHLDNYTFSLRFLSDDQARLLGISNKLKGQCLAFGILSMSNHSDQPTARVLKEVSQQRVVISLQATQDILPGQEITHAYSTTWFDKID